MVIISGCSDVSEVSSDITASVEIPAELIGRTSESLKELKTRCFGVGQCHLTSYTGPKRVMVGTLNAWARCEAEPSTQITKLALLMACKYCLSDVRPAKLISGFCVAALISLQCCFSTSELPPVITHGISH